MSNEELKPCPFCGGQLDPSYETFKGCEGCGAEVYMDDASWNARAPITREQVNEWCKAEGDGCCNARSIRY